jgi:aminoglycoside phosphotransferase (APT) family kinase protein
VTADSLVRDLLHRTSRAAQARWAGATLVELRPLHGGVSSLTFEATLRRPRAAPQRVVLKAAPPGLAPVRNRDVLRQARLLRALQDLPGVPVPAVLLEDFGDPPTMPPLFVMDFVDGEAFEPKKDVAPKPPEPEVVIARAKAATRVLASLHSPDPRVLGLSSEPVVNPSDELERWAMLYATAGDEFQGRQRTLYRQLAETAPAAVAPRVVHGDYRLGNIQFDGSAPTAIIDWEIWSVGDPRTDVAWLLAYSDPVQRFVLERDPANQAAADAMPGQQELLSEYQSARQIELAGFDWFLALSYYKIASTTAVLAKRNRRQPTPDPGLELAASSIPDVLARGLEIHGHALVAR